jgi:hypothetical protein
VRQGQAQTAFAGFEVLDASRLCVSTSVASMSSVADVAGWCV